MRGLKRLTYAHARMGSLLLTLLHLVVLLRTIARTECLRMIRRKLVTTVPLDDIAPIAAQPVSDNLDEAELRSVLAEAITTLPERDRTVIALRYMSDLSYQEMSEFLDVPVSAVKKRLHDAQKRLLSWFSHATGERARWVLRDYRPSRDERLEKRVMNLTAFLDAVVRGDVDAVTAALKAQPELRDARDELKPLLDSANALGSRSCLAIQKS